MALEHGRPGLWREVVFGTTKMPYNNLCCCHAHAAVFDQCFLCVILPTLRSKHPTSLPLAAVLAVSHSLTSTDS